MSDLAYYFISVFRDIVFPTVGDITEEAVAFFQYGNDIVLAYNGQQSVLIQAVRAYWATDNRAYAYAGAANVLVKASYLGNIVNFFQEGLNEAIHLIETAKTLAPNRYEIEFVEAFIYNAKSNTDKLEMMLKHLQRYEEASTDSGYARLQMHYWSNRGNLIKVREWYERGLQLTEQENDIRRMAIIAQMAATLLNKDGFTDETIALYRQVVQLNPHNAWAWHDLSYIYASRKEYEKAGECNRRALDIMQFPAAEAIAKVLIEIWEKSRHKDPIKEYPRYLSSTTARSDKKAFNWLFGREK